LTRDRIVCGVMRPGLFPSECFDVVCLFQVFDHLPDPGAVLDACREALRPGGLVLAINHNIGAVSARLLGERSPIVDVEHTYLYSHTTMARLFAARGFMVKSQGAVWNTYRLRYLARLLPLPRGIKGPLLRWLGAHWPGRVRLRVPLGNLFLIAQKPLTDSPGRVELGRDPILNP
jgi:SAM-dependent methyltransferase